MEKDWVKIYRTQQEYKADILLEVLEENEIEGVIINKKDSSYVVIGDVEVYVHIDNEEKAKQIVETFELE